MQKHIFYFRCTCGRWWFLAEWQPDAWSKFIQLASASIRVEQWMVNQIVKLCIFSFYVTRKLSCTNERKRLILLIFHRTHTIYHPQTILIDVPNRKYSSHVASSVWRHVTKDYRMELFLTPASDNEMFQRWQWQKSPPQAHLFSLSSFKPDSHQNPSLIITSGHILSWFESFLHALPWIWSWIKQVRYHLSHAITIVASRDALCNLLWRHQQNVNRARETTTVFLPSFMGPLCRVQKMMYVPSWRTVYVLTRVLF